jgi:hypothetical protein
MSCLDRPFTLYETGQVCKRLAEHGWDASRIANELNLSSTSQATDLLMLMNSDIRIVQKVAEGALSTTLAISILKHHPENAADVIEEAAAASRAAGDTKILPRHLKHMSDVDLGADS